MGSMLEVFILLSIGLAIELMCFLMYYFQVIARKAPPLSQMSFISDEANKDWSTPLLEGFRMRPWGIACLTVCCPCMRIADTWHAAGLMKFWVGVWVPQCMLPF